MVLVCNRVHDAQMLVQTIVDTAGQAVVVLLLRVHMAAIVLSRSKLIAGFPFAIYVMAESFNHNCGTNAKLTPTHGSGVSRGERLVAMFSDAIQLPCEGAS